MKNFINNITFVIVCFNSRNIIKKCINSIDSKAKILVVENSNNYLIKKELGWNAKYSIEACVKLN